MVDQSRRSSKTPISERMEDRIRRKKSSWLLNVVQFLQNKALGDHLVGAIRQDQPGERLYPPGHSDLFLITLDHSDWKGNIMFLYPFSEVYRINLRCLDDNDGYIFLPELIA